MKLSPKKQQELYNAVHDEIMNMRIRIKKILTGDHGKPITVTQINLIDDCLSDLCMKAPIAATKLFKEAEKKKTPPHPAFKRCVDLFHISYPDIPIDGAKDGSKINSIIRKLEANARAKGKEVTNDTAFNGFAYVIQYAKRTGHWVDGKNLSAWDSKLGELIHEINNGKQQRTSSANDIRDFAANL